MGQEWIQVAMLVATIMLVAGARGLAPCFGNAHVRRNQPPLIRSS